MLRIGCGSALRLLLVSAVLIAVTDFPAAESGAIERELARQAARGTKVGLFAVVAGADAPFVLENPDLPLVPASTAKLVTTACALDVLGPAHRFVTRLYASAPVRGGTTDGALHWQGSGDPGIRGEDLFAIGRRLRASGLSTVAGGMSAPPASPADEGVPAVWPAPHPGLTDPYAAGIGPLSVAWNAAQLVVRPGETPGSPATIDFFPLEPGTPVEARVVTASSTKIDVRIVPANARDPARLSVRGSIAHGASPWTRWIRLGPPSRAFLGAAAAAFGAAGIEVGAPPSYGPIPGGAVLLHEHEGRSLAELVRDVNKYSSNFGAEMLLRAIGSSASGRWSTDAGLAAMRQCAERLTGSPLADGLHDGSGYSRRSRLRARGLAQLVDAASANGGWGHEFAASLPLAGADGSLEKRLPALRGRLRAKTGTLSGVSSLAGIYNGSSGERLIFALILNGEKSRVGPAEVDRLVSALVESFEARPVTVPAAAPTGSAETAP